MKKRRLLLGNVGVGKSTTMKALLAEDIQNTNDKILLVDGEGEYHSFIDAFSMVRLEDDNLKKDFFKYEPTLKKNFVFDMSSIFKISDAKIRDNVVAQILANISKFIEINNIDTVYIDSGILFEKLVKNVREYPNFRRVKLICTGVDINRDMISNYELLLNDYYIFKSYLGDLGIIDNCIKYKIGNLKQGLFYDGNSNLRETLILNLDEHEYEIL